MNPTRKRPKFLGVSSSLLLTRLYARIELRAHASSDTSSAQSSQAVSNHLTIQAQCCSASAIVLERVCRQRFLKILMVRSFPLVRETGAIVFPHCFLLEIKAELMRGGSEESGCLTEIGANRILTSYQLNGFT